MTQKSSRRDGIIVALAILLLAAVMGWRTLLIPSEAAYAQVGPAVVPWIVTAALALLGAALLVQAVTGVWQPAAAEAPFNRRTAAWLAAGLLVNVTTISTVGFIIASTALFVCVARAFDSTRPLRDALVGFSLALTAYLAFDRVLDYDIGSGVVESLI